MSKIVLFFILSYTGSLVAAIVVDGVWAFYIYQLVYFLNPAYRWWGSSLPDISYSFITVLFMFAGLMIRLKQSSHIRYFEMPLTKWVLGILGMYVFMLLFALSPDHHKQALIEFTKLILIVGIAYKLINTRKKLEMAIWAYIVGATYIGYVATSMGRNSGDRLEGIGTIDSPDSNGTAAILVPALIFLIYYVWQGKNKYIKISAILCGALIANGVVLINSRGAFLGAAIGVVAFISIMLFSKVRLAKQRRAAVFLIIAGIASTAVVTDELFWERMSTLEEVTDEEGDRGGAHRTEFWMATFDVLSDYPLGVGVRGFNMVSSNYVDPALTKGGTARKAVHSMWFQGLSEIGYQGFFLFICLLISCYRLTKSTRLYLLKADRKDEYFKIVAIEIALLSYLVSSTFIDRFRSELLYWLILFVACSANIYYFQEVANSENKTKKFVKLKETIINK